MNLDDELDGGAEEVLVGSSNNGSAARAVEQADAADGDCAPLLDSEEHRELSSKHASRCRFVSLSKLHTKEGHVPSDIADLVESLERCPQLQTVVVRPHPKKDGHYEIITGHRRIEALAQLKRGQAWVMVFEADDATAEIYALEENLRRKDVNRPEALAKLVRAYEKATPSKRGGDRRSATFQSGHDGQLVESAVEKAAKKAGVSARTARRAAKVSREGTTAVNDAYKAGRITVNEAEILAALEAEAQDERLGALLRSKFESDEITQATLALTKLEKKLVAFGDKTTTAERREKLRLAHAAVGERIEALKVGAAQ